MVKIIFAKRILSWVELMRLGWICLVIVNYCHSSLYSQFFFFFCSLHVYGSFHSKCHHSSLPISLSRHQPFYTYGIHMLWEKEKKKKQKAIRIGCHDPHHLSQLDDDCHCCTFTFTCTHNFFFITYRLVAIFKYCCLVFNIMEIRVWVL